MKLRFLGTECTIGDHPSLKTFGQVIELDETLALEAIAGGAALIPEAEFAALGFTADELREYAQPGLHQFAPPTFLDKKRAGLLKLHEIRTAGAFAKPRAKGGE